MGQLDDLIYSGRRGIGTSSGTSRNASNYRFQTDGSTVQDFAALSIDDLISSYGDYTSVTSRDQIINPDAIIASRKYSNDEAGQLQLQKDLNALRTYAAQQEAAYLEYYNSPEQQAIRDREAGLNPDILGLSGSEGVQSQQVTSNPNEGILSDEEQRAQKIQNAASIMSAITGIFSGVANICQIPAVFKGMKLTDSQIALNKAQTGLIGAQTVATGVGSASSLLGNIESFEKLAGVEIASRLADSASAAIQSGQSLDLAKWFGDESNFSGILESYAPDSSPQYASAFANLRKRMQQNLGNAYSQGKITAENQGAFSSLVADSRYSSDQLVQIAYLRPYMAAQAKAELARIKLEQTLADWNTRYHKALSVDSAVNAANNKNEYDAEYWENMNAELQAGFENFKATVENLSLQFTQEINTNLLEMYRQFPDSEKGFSAAYLFKSGSNATLQDYFYSNNMTEFSNMIQDQMTILNNEATYGKFESFKELGKRSYRITGPFNLSWSRDRYKNANYYQKLLEKLAD